MTRHPVPGLSRIRRVARAVLALAAASVATCHRDIAGPATATQLLFSVQPGNTIAGDLLSPAVKVRAADAQGHDVPGFTGSVTVGLGANPGGGTLAGTTTVRAVSGVATFDDLRLNRAGTGYTLTVAASGLTGATSESFAINPGSATQVAFTGQPATTVAGQTMTPAVQVTALDPVGNPVPAFTGTVSVSFGNNPGGAALGGTTSVAAVSGVASFGDLRITKASAGYWLTARATGLIRATSSEFVITPATATQLAFAVQPGTTVADHQIAPAVKVQALDTFGNLATGFTGGIAVALGNNPGGATLGGTSAIAAFAGIATFSDLSIKQTGTGYTLAATSTGLSLATSAAFDVTPGTATQLLFTVQPTTTVAGQPITPAVQVTALDPAGNPVPGFTGTVTVAFGNNPGGAALAGTTSVAAVSGVATFGDLRITKASTGYWLTATAAGLNKGTSSDFGILPGAATQVVFGVQPGTTVADHQITPAVKVRALDAWGNLATSFAGSVSIAVGANPGGGTLSGTSPIAAVSGVATFFDLSIDKAGAGYTLMASAGGFSPATSPPFDITPGVATQLAFTGQPSNAVAGVAISPAVHVTALDQAGNPVPGFTGTVTVAFGNNPGGGTLGGTTSVAAVGGVASFGDLSITKTGANYWLTATATGLSTATSFTFTITAAVATQIGFGVQPTTTVADHQIAPAVKVRAFDAFGNLATGFTGNVSVALGSNPAGGTLSGTIPVAAVGGVATFFDLSINKTGVGYTLTASAAGFSAITSAAFDITPGTATQLTFIAQPTTTVAGRLITPALQVLALDRTGNPVPGFTGTVTLAFGGDPGGATLSGTTSVAAVNGVASFGDLSITKTGPSYWLTATATGLSRAASNNFPILPGPATQLVFGVQPTTITGGTIFSPTVKVRALDALGNLATDFTGDVHMELGVSPSGQALQGTTTVTAVNGVANFLLLSVNAAAFGYTLVASAAGLPAATSVPFEVLIGPASHLDFQVRPKNEIAGTPIGDTYVQLRGEDAGGNLDTTFTGVVTVGIAANPGGGTLSGTMAVTAVGGLAKFSDLSIDKAGTGYTLSFASAGLLGVTSLEFNITSAAATRLVFTVQPTNTAAGATITPPVQVTALDAFGNVATGFTGKVTVAIGTHAGGGALGGTVTVTAVGGLATFSDLRISSAGVGYTLTAAAGAVTGDTSAAFTVN